jgi:hypothetical protein
MRACPSQFGEHMSPIEHMLSMYVTCAQSAKRPKNIQNRLYPAKKIREMVISKKQF